LAAEWVTAALAITLGRLLSEDADIVVFNIFLFNSMIRAAPKFGHVERNSAVVQQNMAVWTNAKDIA
jgi:hypothetical protein